MIEINIQIDPNLDLVLERTVDVRPELVWAAWTDSEHLKHWFTPAPWKTIDCEIDLRPGGMFRTVMQSPEGEEFPGTGCYLDVVVNRRLVWTSALGPGFRPSPDRPMRTCLYGVVSIEPDGDGTKLPRGYPTKPDDAEARDMGFHEAGPALDQLSSTQRACERRARAEDVRALRPVRRSKNGRSLLTAE